MYEMHASHKSASEHILSSGISSLHSTRLMCCGMQVGIEYSAGFTAALAGALQMRTSWAVCQQGRVMQ